jgi:hypothetical protein
MANFSGKAPTLIVWVISLVLYLVALAAHFGIVNPGRASRRGRLDRRVRAAAHRLQGAGPIAS